MQALSVKVKYESKLDTVNLWALADVHAGAAACDEKLFERDVKLIAADPTARVILLGDMIDAIGRHDEKRRDQRALAGWCADEEDVIGAQVEWFLNAIAPIMHQVDAVVEGNHEYAVLKHTGSDVYRRIVKRIAAFTKRNPEDLALGVNGFVRYHFRQHYHTGKSGNGWPMTIFCHHGKGGGTTNGGHARILDTFLSQYEADLCLVGHLHGSSVVRRTTYRMSGSGQIVPRHSMGVMVSSYLQHGIKKKHTKHLPSDSYSERKGYPPPPALGASQIVIEPNQRTFYVVQASGGNGSSGRLLSVNKPLEAAIAGKDNG